MGCERPPSNVLFNQLSTIAFANSGPTTRASIVMIWATLLRLARSAKPKATFGYREVLKQTLGHGVQDEKAGRGAGVDKLTDSMQHLRLLR